MQDLEKFEPVSNEELKAVEGGLVGSLLDQGTIGASLFNAFTPVPDITGLLSPLVDLGHQFIP